MHRLEHITIAAVAALLAASVGPPASGREGAHLILAQATLDATGSTADPNQTLRPAERDFIRQELENGRSELDLAKLAVGQARSSELREFAQQLVADFNQIDSSLEEMARRKTVNVPLQPTSYSASYRDLAQHAGPSFDAAFLRRIAAANQRAFQLCEAALAAGRDPDVRQLAGSLLPIIRDHGNKITDLRKRL